MKTSDFYIKPSSKNINESMAKKFGEKLDLDSYSNDQLESAYTLIENKISELKNSNFNDTLENEEYHRLTFMKDVVKAAISERAVSKAQQKAAGIALSAIRGKGKAKGASKEMMKMSMKELEKMAGTKHKGLPEKKKKVDESMQTMFELAKDLASKYAEAHRKGDHKKMKFYQEALEDCGATVSHGPMGECMMSHPMQSGGKPMPITVLNPMGSMSVMTSEKSMKESAKKAKKDYDGDGKIESPKDEYLGSRDKAIKKAMSKNKSVKEALGTIANQLKASKFKDSDVARMDREERARKAKLAADEKKKDKKPASLKESIDRLLAEGEEAKAELVMAIKNMVDKFTGWSEDIAKMQAQTAMEMADDIRDEMGSDQAEAFSQAVQPALDAAFQSVKAAREALNGQVGSMTGSAPATSMTDPDMGSDVPPMDSEEPAPDTMDQDMTPAGDEEDLGAASEPASGGREKRESIERTRRLARILSGR